MAKVKRPEREVAVAKKGFRRHQKDRYRRAKIGALSLAALLGMVLALLANSLEWRPGVAYAVGAAVIVVFVGLMVPAIDRERPKAS